MTAIHPHQLKPCEAVRSQARRCMSALPEPQPDVPLVTVVDVVRYLRRALGLAVHVELVLAWIADGLPVLKMPSHDNNRPGVRVFTTDNRALTWLMEHGSSPTGRLRVLARSRLRSSNAGLNRSSIGRSVGAKPHPRQNNNPMRGPKAKGRRGHKGPVHEV